MVQVKVDANWADDAIDRKSTSGGVTGSRRQVLEASCMQWARVLNEWGEPTVPVLYSDSSSALHVAKKRGLGRTEHIALRMLALQEWWEQATEVCQSAHKTRTRTNMLTKQMTKRAHEQAGDEVGAERRTILRSTITGDGLEQQRRQESLKRVRPRLARCGHRDSALEGVLGITATHHD